MSIREEIKMAISAFSQLEQPWMQLTNNQNFLVISSKLTMKLQVWSDHLDT